MVWALERGLRAGCDPLLYCTYNRTLRDEMAVFLSRLLDLPVTSTDAFADDDGTRYEAYINRVAAAGLIDPCRTGDFCPARAITRAETAVAIARALALPESETDHFIDDDGTTAEPAINAMADAGLMAGCAADRFCPGDQVIRGQMARFLRAAFAG